MKRAGLFKPPAPSASLVPYETFADLIDMNDAKYGGPSVVFVDSEGHESTVVTWGSAAERDRMNHLLFLAHRGHFEKWAMQLDPEAYVEDFNRFYAEMLQDGPATSSDLHAWVAERYGEYELSNALGCALDWRQCELDDQAAGGSSRRLGRFEVPSPWIDVSPAARRLYLKLGKGLVAEGLLAGPYDERTYDFEEGLTSMDAGPARLIALMTVAVLAAENGDPDAADLMAAVRAGIPSVPPGIVSERLWQKWVENGGDASRGKSCPECQATMGCEIGTEEDAGRWVTYVCVNEACPSVIRGYPAKEKCFEPR
jgi:hypothetical protein